MGVEEDKGDDVGEELVAAAGGGEGNETWINMGGTRGGGGDDDDDDATAVDDDTVFLVSSPPVYSLDRSSTPDDPICDGDIEVEGEGKATMGNSSGCKPEDNLCPSENGSLSSILAAASASNRLATSSLSCAIDPPISSNKASPVESKVLNGSLDEVSEGIELDRLSIEDW
ncbi:hypothetical protein BGW38_006474 [Lunasporangiospora selenospora]|uniref:Uncharacterized protein n=1 Tax=Lunasporangiospora selenospora TaxID=979761 RepID=A0A9P6KA96_9FUNG|nr:hypothetical protein BGW38_006474 [Lunasporangiospora selenospora]